MNKVKNNKVLGWLVIILLLFNVGLLIYFLSGRHGSGAKTRKGSIVEYVKKSLSFSEEQTTQYEKLYDIHRDSLRILGDSLRDAKHRFFRLLQQQTIPDSITDAAANAVAARQLAIELNNFRHFQKVRALCKTEQQAKFDSLMIRMVNKQTAFYRSSRSDSGKTSH